MDSDPIGEGVLVPRPGHCIARGDGTHNPGRCHACLHHDQWSALDKVIKTRDAAIIKELRDIYVFNRMERLPSLIERIQGKPDA